MSANTEGITSTPVCDQTSGQILHYGLTLSDPVYYPELRRRAQYNRNHPTEAERLLWYHLSGKGLDGHKFRRQHIISQYIVDFVSLANKLIIEIDGGYHNDPDQQNDDAIRTENLNRLGFHVVRFSNEDVLSHIDQVLTEIKEKLSNE